MAVSSRGTKKRQKNHTEMIDYTLFKNPIPSRVVSRIMSGLGGGREGFALG